MQPSHNLIWTRNTSAETPWTRTALFNLTMVPLLLLFFFFSFIKDQWTVLPVSVERGALTLALSGQMGTAFMTGMSQWTVGCKACLTPLLKETHSGIWHLSGPTVRIAVGGCLLQPYLLTIQVFVRCLWKCNLLGIILRTKIPVASYFLGYVLCSYIFLSGWCLPTWEDVDFVFPF